LQCRIERDNAYASGARFHTEAIIAAGADIEQRFFFPIVNIKYFFAFGRGLVELG